MLGKNHKELKESKDLLRMQVVAESDMDMSHISKMENNNKPVSGDHLNVLAKIHKLSKSKLIPCRLGEKVLKALEGKKNKMFSL